MTDTETSRDQPRLFPVTQWTVVLAAGGTASPEATAALERLCTAYWYPLYAFVRRGGHAPPDAQDLTQEPAETSTPEQVFEKQWALTLLASVLRRLREDYAREDKGRLFEALGQWGRSQIGLRGWSQKLVEEVAQHTLPKRRKPRPSEIRCVRHRRLRFPPLKGSRADARTCAHVLEAKSL